MAYWKNDNDVPEPKYSEADLVRIAKRQNNSKRAYLLVNPLQGKHMPVSPGAALSMMEASAKVVCGRLAQGSTSRKKLLIAFAETATAIGAFVAEKLGEDTLFLTTTREPLDGVNRIEFLEEHSHAVEQRLCLDFLREHIAGRKQSHHAPPPALGHPWPSGEVDTIVMLDDELSTGKTLRNTVQELRQSVPEVAGKRIIAASVINRLTEENTDLLRAAGIETVCLLKLRNSDYTEEVKDLTTNGGTCVSKMDSPLWQRVPLEKPLSDPRRGVVIGEYARNTLEQCLEIINNLETKLLGMRKILVLGTEECMYPSIILGRELERRFPQGEVFCQSTTRSPIGIWDAKGYPITNGICLPSFYDENRRTYLYNLDSYDAVILFTDAQELREAPLSALGNALSSHGDPTLYAAVCCTTSR